MTDNGRGFDPAGTSEGNGLASMHMRAQKLGGTLDVSSPIGHGTSVTLRVPLDPNPAPMNYLQVFYQDVLYADANLCAQITDPITHTKFNVTAQDMLIFANQNLLAIGEPSLSSSLPQPPQQCVLPPPLPPPPCKPNCV